LNLQILALSLIPLLSGIVPDDRTMAMPAHLLGLEERVTEEFLIGTWKYSEDFFRWGPSDKDKAKIKPFRGNAYMQIEKGGTMKMVNLFRPSEPRWKLTQEGILIYDPKYPERTSRILPVKKRDKDRIWVMLPFAGGATGIGMVRVPDDELSSSVHKTEKPQEKRRMSSHRSRPAFSVEPSGADVPLSNPTPLNTSPAPKQQDY
jgi:hypothetical protein